MLREAGTWSENSFSPDDMYRSVADRAPILMIHYRYFNLWRFDPFVYLSNTDKKLGSGWWPEVPKTIFDEKAVEKATMQYDLKWLYNE